MESAGTPADHRPDIGAWAAVPRPARPVVRELLIHGPQTRTSLARSLGLSTGSLTRLTKPLVRTGLVVERGIVHHHENGRPTRPLDLAADDWHFLGVKLTADRVHAVRTDLRARVLDQAEEPLAERTPEAVGDQARRLMERLGRGQGPPVAAGFALGGSARPGRPAGEQRFDAPFLGWWDLPLERTFRERLGVPCVVRNDVAALAHSQHWFGAARGIADFALVTVGAGIGYALVVHGRLVPATEEDLVEFSHHVLDPGGPICPDGHRGCVVSYLSTQSVLSAAAHGLRRQVPLADVARLAREGDAVCENVTRQAGWAVGATAATIVNLTMVKTVVVTGEGVDLALAGERHIEGGLAHRRHRNRDGVTVSLLPHDFAEWARGGAVAAIRALVTDDGPGHPGHSAGLAGPSGPTGAAQGAAPPPGARNAVSAWAVGSGASSGT